MLNRSAIIVRAKQPFLEWLRQLPDSVRADLTLEDVNDEPQIYLLPQYEMRDEQEGLLRDCYEHLFRRQLEGWWKALDCVLCGKLMRCLIQTCQCQRPGLRVYSLLLSANTRAFAQLPRLLSPSKTSIRHSTPFSSMSISLAGESAVMSRLSQRTLLAKKSSL